MLILPFMKLCLCILGLILTEDVGFVKYVFTYLRNYLHIICAIFHNSESFSTALICTF